MTKRLPPRGGYVFEYHHSPLLGDVLPRVLCALLGHEWDTERLSDVCDAECLRCGTERTVIEKPEPPPSKAKMHYKEIAFRERATDLRKRLERKQEEEIGRAANTVCRLAASSGISVSEAGRALEHVRALHRARELSRVDRSPSPGAPTHGSPQATPPRRG